MAKFVVTGFDYLENLMNEAGAKSIKAVEDGLNESIPEVKKAEHDAIERAAKKRTGTGFLKDSIQGMPVRHNAYGMFTVIGPIGIHHKNIKKGEYVRNAEVAAYLEYGTRKQEPSPWMQTVVNATEQKVIERLQKKVDEAVEDL